jgi:Secretion system C-terminal sorting domain
MRLIQFLGIIFFSVSILTANAQASSEEMDAHTTSVITPPVKLFPNPAIHFIDVKIENLNAADVHVSLHNIIGNEISAEKEILNSNEIRVRLKDIPSGYYLLALRDDKNHFRGTYKFLKRDN